MFCIRLQNMLVLNTNNNFLSLCKPPTIQKTPMRCCVPFWLYPVLANLPLYMVHVHNHITGFDATPLPHHHQNEFLQQSLLTSKSNYKSLEYTSILLMLMSPSLTDDTSPIITWHTWEYFMKTISIQEWYTLASCSYSDHISIICKVPKYWQHRNRLKPLTYHKLLTQHTCEHILLLLYFQAQGENTIVHWWKQLLIQIAYDHCLMALYVVWEWIGSICNEQCI